MTDKQRATQMIQGWSVSEEERLTELKSVVPKLKTDIQAVEVALAAMKATHSMHESALNLLLEKRLSAERVQRHLRDLDPLSHERIVVSVDGTEVGLIDQDARQISFVKESGRGRKFYFSSKAFRHGEFWVTLNKGEDGEFIADREVTIWKEA